MDAREIALVRVWLYINSFLGLGKLDIITKNILGRPVQEPVKNPDLVRLGGNGIANRLDASIAIKYGTIMLLLSFWIAVTFD